MTATCGVSGFMQSILTAGYSAAFNTYRDHVVLWLNYYASVASLFTQVVSTVCVVTTCVYMIVCVCMRVHKRASEG